MISKTLFGINFFDEKYGGVYRGRPVLLIGHKGTGKTVVGLQFIQQGLRQGERCLMLSTMAANDLAIHMEGLGFPMTDHIDKGHLIILEYRNFVNEYGHIEQEMLPTEGFEQLREIIDTNTIQRVVLDTVTPLVAVRSPDRMNEHVFSFIRSFDRMGVTTLITLPKPVSAMALRLKKVLDNAVPVSILLDTADDNGHLAFQTIKYLGSMKLAPPVIYTIKPGVGIAPATPDGNPQAARNDGAPAKADTNGRHASHHTPELLKEAYAAAGWVDSAVKAAPETHTNAPLVEKQVPGAKPQVRFSTVWTPKSLPTEIVKHTPE